MILNKSQKMLIGTAIGDAYGFDYEGKSFRKIIDKIDFTRYGKHHGNYSDDTQQTIAIAELLSSDNAFTPVNLAIHLMEAYRRDPRRGYASRTKTILKNAKDPIEFLRYRKKKPISNGSVMRTLPIGLIPNIEKVKSFSKMNAEITHFSQNAVKATVMTSLASHYFYYNLGKPKNVVDFCVNESEDIFPEYNDYFLAIKKMNKLDRLTLLGKKGTEKGLPCNARLTAGAVFYILQKYYDSPAEILKESVLVGGDVASLASFSLGLSLMNNDLDSLPPFLFEDLENSKYGRDYLIKLGKTLDNKFPAL